ncbi:hypothetical protein CFOL_v3_13224 [Cephalotus follicularis]|uniref:DUF948 domain-containing protein n=1 Tax=Cephalotus follicularis TaxID=3775 RepID=A0A1Q3BPV4_CEPFO|nr:hypothetical protein CFOL_v3_13224 [Cephalotus follicularis]
MKPSLISSNPTQPFTPLCSLILKNSIPFPRNSNLLHFHFLSLNSHSNSSSPIIPICSSRPNISNEFADTLPHFSWNSNPILEEGSASNFNGQIGNPNVPSFIPTSKLSLSDQAFFLLAFIACTTSVAFTSFVVAAVPTLHAMGRAATSLSKLADTARVELPGTMAAIRLSGMEISDLTLELSDLSQEITDGVNKSAQVVQTAEAGIRQIGALARQHTASMIQERASLPVISLQPVVAGAAKKTSQAVGQATKTLINLISRGEFSSENYNDNGIDRLDI